MVMAFALAAAALFGSADFLGGVASRRAKAASVLVISAPAGMVVLFAAAMLTGAPFQAAGLGWALAAGAAGGAGRTAGRARNRAGLPVTTRRPAAWGTAPGRDLRSASSFSLFGTRARRASCGRCAWRGWPGL